MSLPIDPLALDVWPITSDAVFYRLDVTDADANISLPVGGYKIALRSSEPKGCTIKFGAAAALPADGANASSSAPILPGVYLPVFIRTATALHAIMNAASATGTLYIVKVR